MCNFYVLITACLCFLFVSSENANTLRLVHVVFGHADQTPSTNSMYPKDPHINQTFYPYEPDQLTNVLSHENWAGKLRAYKLGKALRNKYDTFLGSLYQPSAVESLSSCLNVPKMTLQLVLAGLFPPNNTLLNWSDELNWQPILYNSIDNSTDHLLTEPFYNCPRYAQLYNEFLSSPQGLAVQKRHGSLFYYLTEHTGWSVKTSLEVLNVYRTLVSEANIGLLLPVWARAIFPKVLSQAAGKENVISTFTREMRQLSGGFLLKKIINDTLSKINGTLSRENGKIFLYSANDGVVARLLGALQLLNPHVPPYCAYVLMELHELNHIYGFKIFYQSYFTIKPVLLTLPRCGDFCPMDVFIELLQDNMPRTENACNFDV